MTGKEFERMFCKLLQHSGYWAVNIQPNEWGAQPFDVLAIHGSHIIAADCKVCVRSTFPLDRVEDNQWTAFELVNERTNAEIGLAVYESKYGDIKWIPYNVLKMARDYGNKSINLANSVRWYKDKEIKEILGGEF